MRVKLSELQLRHPRQWGACWLACHLYEELGLDQFWAERLPPSRKGTRWDLVLQTLCAYRLIDPGSEWRLHRHWFEHSAMGDLLGADFGQLAESAQALRLPRFDFGTQSGVVRSPHAALEGFVQREIRRAALRSDQHLF